MDLHYTSDDDLIVGVWIGHASQPIDKAELLKSQILSDYEKVEDILTGKIMIMGTGDYEERRNDHEIVNRLRERRKELVNECKGELDEELQKILENKK